MTTLPIYCRGDIANARTQLRNIILAEKWSSRMCLRAVSALTSMVELMLDANVMGNVNVEFVQQKGRRGVELNSCLPLNMGQTISLAEMSHQLVRVVDAVKLTQTGNEVHIAASLWGDASGDPA